MTPSRRSDDALENPLPGHTSKCCGASVHTESGAPDFIGHGRQDNTILSTCWSVCDSCDEPCDVTKGAGHD